MKNEIFKLIEINRIKLIKDLYSLYLKEFELGNEDYCLIILETIGKLIDSKIPIIGK